MNSIVATRRLTKNFRSVRALEDFSCDIGAGEVVGLLGPNGSGKSTLVRLLLGFLQPSRGAATIMGSDCTTESVEVRRNVAYLPGDARLFRTMRGKDVLRFFGSIRPGGNARAGAEIARRLDLDLSRWVAFMSTGMRQKLALAVVLAFDAPVLILDEPTSNLDPTVRSEVLKLISEARSKNRSVVFCSHVMSEVEAVCDRVLILRDGKLVHMQSLKELDQKHRIQARWQGHRPPVPDAVRQSLGLKNDAVDMQPAEDQLTLDVETAEQLSVALQWLARFPPASLEVQQVDLESIYRQFHREIQ